MLSLLKEGIVEEEPALNRVLLEFFGKLQWASSVVEVNLLAAEAVEQLKQVT